MRPSLSARHQVGGARSAFPLPSLYRGRLFPPAPIPLRSPAHQPPGGACARWPALTPPATIPCRDYSLLLVHACSLPPFAPPGGQLACRVAAQPRAPAGLSVRALQRRPPPPPSLVPTVSLARRLPPALPVPACSLPSLHRLVGSSRAMLLRSPAPGSWPGRARALAPPPPPSIGVRTLALAHKFARRPAPRAGSHSAITSRRLF